MICPTSLALLRAPAFLPDSLNTFLFESQWLYWIAALILAAILFHLARLRQNRELRLAALGLAILTLLWIAAAFLLLTPRERLYAAHKDLAKAAGVNDVDRILSYFAEDFQCPALAIQNPADAKDQIASRLKAFGIRSNTITAYTSDMSGSDAVTRLTILTQTAHFPVKSTWRLTWQDLPRDDWKIERAELQSVNDTPLPHIPTSPSSFSSF